MKSTRHRPRLDYTKTVFEVISNKIGAQGTIRGGRYDGPVETLGGQKPGIGFGIGMERLLLLCRPRAQSRPCLQCDVFVNTFGDTERSEICTLLRAGA
ncbi:MAG: hypothetical protein ACLT0Y_02040 [Christensenellales bacterium]